MEQAELTSLPSGRLGAWDCHLRDVSRAARCHGWTTRLTLARGNHEVGAIILQIGEADMGDGSRVTVAGQGDVLLRGFGGHGCAVNEYRLVIRKALVAGGKRALGIECEERVVVLDLWRCVVLRGVWFLRVVDRREGS